MILGTILEEGGGILEFFENESMVAFPFFFAIGGYFRIFKSLDL